MYLLFAGALVSAILSTVDSTLLVCCSLWAHNLRPRAHQAASELASARLSLLVFGALALFLAATAEGVYALVEAASAFGSSGILVLVLMGLFTRRGSRASALGALGLGLASYLGGLAAGWSTPYLASLGGAALGYAAPLLWGWARNLRTNH